MAEKAAPKELTEAKVRALAEMGFGVATAPNGQIVLVTGNRTTLEATIKKLEEEGERYLGAYLFFGEPVKPRKGCGGNCKDCKDCKE